MPEPTSLLEDKIILVTGAGSGIGAMAALSYAKQGATVILLGKTIAKLETVYDAIDNLGYPEGAIYPLHLEGASLHDYDVMADKLDETFGHLDGILHCAATLPYLCRIKDYDVEDFMKIMQTNFNAPFMLTQACLPLLEKSEDASVIFTSDTTGRKAKAYWGAYSTSKFAIEGLMQTLAEEYEDSHIRFNSIDPGPTRTDLRKGVFPAEDPTLIKTADKLEDIYTWLMSKASSETKGQALNYDKDFTFE